MIGCSCGFQQRFQKGTIVTAEAVLTTTTTLDSVLMKNVGVPMPAKKEQRETCCNPNRELKDRPLLLPIQAGGLAAVFKVLANDTCLRLLHAPSVPTNCV